MMEKPLRKVKQRGIKFAILKTKASETPPKFIIPRMSRLLETTNGFIELADIVTMEWIFIVGGLPHIDNFT